MQRNNTKSRRTRESPPTTQQSAETEERSSVNPEPVASHLLQGLKSTQLSKMMQEKKVLHRSKYTTKAQMIRVLRPLLTRADILGSQPSIDAPNSKPTSRSTSTRTPKHAPPGTCQSLAIRYDCPVMGIDVHRDTLAYAVVDPTQILTAGEIENSTVGEEELLSICAQFHVVCVGMESTSEYWLPISWTLQHAGIDVLVANPLQTKATQGVKTDPIDAHRIAYALRDGRLKPSVLCTEAQYALRKDLRELVHQVDSATAIKNRIQQIFHKTRASDEVTKFLKSDRGMRILAGIADARSRDEVYVVIKDAFAHYRGKTQDPTRLDPNARMTWAFLAALDRLHDRSRFFELLEELVQHKAREKELLLTALQYAQDHPSFRKDLELLLTIPSLGLQSAVIILAEIVDIHRFATVKRLTKWAGLVPKTNKSGYRKRSRGHLYKGGNKYLRRTVWLSAQSDARLGDSLAHPVGKVIVDLRGQRNKTYKQAVTAGAHKLLRIIYGVLTTQTAFHECSDPEDQARLARSTQRKLAELDRTLTLTQSPDIVPYLLERLQQSVMRAERAKGQLAQLYKDVFLRDLPEDKLIMEGE